MNVFVTSLFFVLAFFSSNLTAQAYSDFIGYGYRNCMVCHYSPSGGGALTDYGRALYATEIAANPFSGKVNNEEIAEYSRFLGKKELPWWLRLGYKYRSLNYQKDPGSKQQTTTVYQMQNDANLNFFFNQKQNWGLISTLGWVDEAASVSPNKAVSSNSKMFFREYYLRGQISKNIWLYAGFLDKTFGLRHPDHTSYSRSRIALGQNDQVHSLMGYWAQDKQDLIAQFWMGNAHLSKADQAAGGSLFYESELGDKKAVGFSLLTEKKESSERQSLAMHGKLGFKNHHSLLAELGYSQLATDVQKTASIHIFTQGHIKILRGLFLESTGEYLKSDVQSSVENFKWTVGGLWFPAQRFEVRLSARHLKTINSSTLEKDRWFLLSQIHLSL